MLLSVTVLLGGVLSCSAGGVTSMSSPRRPHVWLLHHDGMGSDGMGVNSARLKLVLVDLQGKLFK